MHYTTNWQELADLVIPKWKSYAQQNNYGCIVWPVPPYKIYNGRYKLYMIRECLQDGDVAIVIDADSIVTNPFVKIEMLLDDEHDLYITEDLKGINTGIFIIRMSEWSRRLVEYCLDKINGGMADCEQNVITELYNIGEKKIKLLPQTAINSYLYEYYPEHGKQEHDNGQWTATDFILHLPGMTTEKRIEIIKEKLNDI